MEIILCVQVPRNAKLKDGRVRVWATNTKELSLDVSRIKEVYYFNGKHYIVYQTDNIDFYKPYTIQQIPSLAYRLDVRFEEEEVYYCGLCGGVMVWDADELFCNCCGAGAEWDAPPKKAVEKWLRITLNRDDEVKIFVEKLLNVRNVETIYVLHRGQAGGFTPQFDFRLIRVKMLNGVAEGITIVQNPAFVESSWNEAETYECRHEGRFIALRLDPMEPYIFYLTFLMKFEGEPDFSIVESLEEEEKRRREELKKLEEERLRQWLQEQEKKRKELEKKWTPEKVVEKAIANLPDWADGAVVYTVVSRTEVDADVIRYLLPIKKSKYNGDYYTSPDWVEIRGVPEQALDKLADAAILRDGRVYKVKISKPSGKYVNIKLAEEVRLG